MVVLLSTSEKQQVSKDSKHHDDDDNEVDADWWKAQTFPHGHVAEETRDDFDILSTFVGEEDEQKPLVYLDSAATSQKPSVVLEALQDYYTKLNSNVHRGAHALSRQATAAYEGARDLVQEFVHASRRDEIVFTSGATEAMNLVAYSYGQSNFGPGDEILITEMEHHSNLVPWQWVAKTTGATLKFARIDKTSMMLDMEHFESQLNDATKMVAFPHVSNVLGCIHPVQDMVQMVRERAPHAKILLDACQSVPHQPVDVQELGVDFLAASGHKMCAPTGIGFLWGKYELLEQMAPFHCGGEMIDQVTMEEATFAPPPARFEAGTPAIAQAIGLGTAIEYLNKVGMKDIEAYEHEMGDYLYRRLQQVPGVTVLGPPLPSRAALCAFVCDGVHPSDLSTFLDLQGVAVRAGHHCCQPLHQALGFSHSARASLYFYNTKEDVDSFIHHLQETLQFFRSVGASTNGDDSDKSVDDDFVPFI